MGIAMKQTKGLWNKIKLLFARPDAVDPSVRDTAERLLHVKNTETVVDKPLNRYVVWQMAVTVTVLFLFILLRESLSLQSEIAAVSFIILTLINCGAIMEQKRWIFYLEFARIIMLAVALLAVYPNGWLMILVLAALLVALYFMDNLKRYYFEVVYKEARNKK